MKPHKLIADFIGKDAGFKLVDDALFSDMVSGSPFNCPPLDIPFGGGLVAGRIYEFFGGESGGKSTFALNTVKAFADHMIATKNEMWGVLWIESESTFDKARAINMDIPLDRFIWFETDVFEDGRDKIRSVLKRAKAKGMRFMVVWDTIAATSTKNEKEVSDQLADLAEGIGDPDKSKKSKINPGGMVEKPRLIKQMFRDVTVDLGETSSIMVIVNQVSTQVGKYGAPLDSTGGYGLRHHASVRSKFTIEDREYMTADSDKLKAIVTRLDFAKNKITGYTNFATHLYLNIESGLDLIETRFICWKSRGIMPKSVGSFTTIKVPAGYAESGGAAKTIDIKFQNSKQFRKIVAEQPWVLDYLDYQTYLNFAAESVLVKVKNIKAIWNFEKKLYGKHITELSDKEKMIAQVLFEDSVKADIKEHEKTAKADAATASKAEKPKPAKAKK